MSAKKTDDINGKSSQNDWREVYVCEHCSTGFDSEIKMLAHEENCKGPRGENTISSNSGSTRHKMKNQINIYRIKCSLCFKQFVSMDKADGHILTEHQGKKFVTVNGKPKCILRYKCKFCNIEFTSETLIHNHYASEHMESKKPNFGVKEDMNQSDETEIQEIIMIDPLSI